MQIAVLVKQVPDTDEVKINDEDGTIIRDSVGNVINPLDLNALEEAVRLKELHGGTITTISMGPPQAQFALREAIALGADHAFLLSDPAFAGADTWATARTLVGFLKKEGPFDVILAGEKATDGETGQVGPEVAVLLDIPFSTYVSETEWQKDSVVVTRTVEEGVQIQSIPYPCLLTVLNNLNETRMPTLAGKKRGRRHLIKTLQLAELCMERDQVGLTGSATRVSRISHPKITRETEVFMGGNIEKGIDKVISLFQDKGIL